MRLTLIPDSINIERPHGDGVIPPACLRTGVHASWVVDALNVVISLRYRVFLGSGDG